MTSNFFLDYSTYLSEAELLNKHYLKFQSEVASFNALSLPGHSIPVISPPRKTYTAIDVMAGRFGQLLMDIDECHSDRKNFRDLVGDTSCFTGFFDQSNEKSVIDVLESVCGRVNSYLVNRLSSFDYLTLNSLSGSGVIIDTNIEDCTIDLLNTGVSEEVLASFGIDFSALIYVETVSKNGSRYKIKRADLDVIQTVISSKKDLKEMRIESRLRLEFLSWLASEMLSKLPLKTSQSIEKLNLEFKDNPEVHIKEKKALLVQRLQYELSDIELYINPKD